MKQPLAIVGASTRAAAASALRAGFQPLAADLFADADLRANATTTRISPYPEGFIDWLRAIDPPAWMYTGALENHFELVDQMAWIAPLWGNPGDVLERVRSPWEMADALRNAGLQFPETRAIADGLPCDGSWLVKTYRGASGSGVRVLGERGSQSNKDAFQSNLLPFSPSPTLCYQRRIAGTPCSAVFVASADDASLLGITRQLVGDPWIGAHGFQYAGSIGPFPVDEQAHATITQTGNVLAREFELSGLFGVDMMLDGNQVWPLEVNPRYTASVEIIERATGVLAIAAHADACNGIGVEEVRAGSSPTPAGAGDRPAHLRLSTHGKAILFARRDIIISEGFAQFALAEAMLQPWPTLADVSSAGTRIESGRPILTVFADGENMDEVERRLRTRVAELEQQIYGPEETL